MLDLCRDDHKYAIYSVVNKKRDTIRGKFILFMLVVKKTYKKS